MWRGDKLVLKRFCISFTDVHSLGVILSLAWALTCVLFVFVLLCYSFFFFFSFCAYILLHAISHLAVMLIHILNLINHKCFAY